MSKFGFSVAVALSIVLGAGCGGEEEPESVVAESCAAENQLGDACIGVPSEPLCASDPCAVESCNKTVVVSNDQELNEAFATMTPGDCVSLSPGNYGGFVLPEGVSVFGRHPDLVKVNGDISSSGSAVWIRGIGVLGGGIHVTSGDTRIDSVRIEDSPADGVSGSTYASVSIDKSEVEGSGRYGAAAFELERLDIQRSILSNSGGPGVWAQCSGGPCTCERPLNLDVEHVKLSGNALVAASFVGVTGGMKNLLVEDTKVGPNFQAGGGVSISGCSSVVADGIAVANSSDFGLLVDDSTIDLSNIDISGNLRGVWIQNIGRSMAGGAVLRSGSIEMNEGVGFGIGSDSLGVEVEQVSIENTQMVALPVLVNGVSAGAQEVGDGLTWLRGAQVNMIDVLIGSSARASMFIDTEAGAGSAITSLTLTGGDEAKGVVLQSYNGGTQPTVNDAPNLDVLADEQFSVPNEIQIPPGI